MNPYRIFTDSSSDIREELLCEWGVSAAQLTLRFLKDGDEHENRDVRPPELYRRMRSGESAATSAVAVGGFVTLFERALSAGEDVLYIGFSSALSGTYNGACVAARQLAARYPERRICTLDSLSASAGLGLLVHLAVKAKREGRTLDELLVYLEGMRHRIVHLFTVDDLAYLARGGRIGRTSAAVGNLLGIKPVLHVDASGRLVAVERVRGRRAAISALCERYGRMHDDVLRTPIYVSHADDPDAAGALCALLEENYGVTPDLITDVGPVIGAHAGPGTLALFFVGSSR